MKERFIQAFWYLILALTISDLLFLLYWMHRYDLIVRSLRSHLTMRLQQQYGHWSDADANAIDSWRLAANYSNGAGPLPPGVAPPTAVGAAPPDKEPNYAAAPLPAWWLLLGAERGASAAATQQSNVDVIKGFDKILTVSFARAARERCCVSP